jgi:hypothetical protein
MDTSKNNLLTTFNNQNMDNNNTEISISLNRRDCPLAQQLTNKLSIVANTNALM